MFRDHYGVLSVTAMGMSLAITEENCVAQFVVANKSIVSAALLLIMSKLWRRSLRK